MIPERPSLVIFYPSHFNRVSAEYKHVNFKNTYFLYDSDSFIILNQRLDINHRLSKILNKSFGNWITSKKYDYL